MKEGAPQVAAGDILRAYGDAGCIGETTATDSDALAYSLTVWGDDIITPEVDGLTAGEPIRLELTSTRPASRVTLDAATPFAGELTYSADALYRVTEAVFDPTLDSLLAALDDFDAAFDSLMTADSIKTVTFDSTLTATRGELDVVTAILSQTQGQLQETLDELALTTSERDAALAAYETLQTETAGAIARLRAVTELVRNTTGNRYQEIEALLQ